MYVSDCENFFPLQDMGPAEKQHLPGPAEFLPDLQLTRNWPTSISTCRPIKLCKF